MFGFSSAVLGALALIGAPSASAHPGAGSRELLGKRSGPCKKNWHCTDFDGCTKDTCENGKCVNADRCDDGDPCTKDTCIKKRFGFFKKCTNEEIESDECTAPIICGEAGQDCCEGEDKCGSGLSCVGAVCSACGGLDEPCCDDEVCDTSDARELVCTLQSSGAPKCQKCGTLNKGCCDGVPSTEPACYGQNECVDEVCVAEVVCGGLDEPCCDDNVCDTSDARELLCTPQSSGAPKCQKCGTLNKGCCDGVPSTEPACYGQNECVDDVCVVEAAPPACGSAIGAMCCDVEPRCGESLLCDDDTGTCSGCGLDYAEVGTWDLIADSCYVYYGDADTPETCEVECTERGRELCTFIPGPPTDCVGFRGNPPEVCKPGQGENEETPGATKWITCDPAIQGGG